MDYSTSSLFYDGHFWVLISQSIVNDQVWIARHVFGTEPTSAQVLDFVQHSWPSPEVLDEAAAQQIPRSYGFKKQLHKNRASQDSAKTVSKAKDQQNLLIAQQRRKATTAARRKNTENKQERQRKALNKHRQKRRGR